ncbi:fungal-specific transcription factor domain-containing protein [Myxozyma melibiosi]|uniref:Fungal-specific transcription factor domain-containing protein n=1 Tax=Myxozyma melibiosi TaxID=54550 RepID=A0ABR1EYV2_9ASCO
MAEGEQTPSGAKRKRQRSRKGLEKLYACDAPDCGKSFTRPEHLARHQLNHSPKEIYRCTWPYCTKSFVRDDLRLRHMKRHSRRSKLNEAEESQGRAGSLQQDGILHPTQQQQQQQRQGMEGLGMVGGDAMDIDRRYSTSSVSQPPQQQPMIDSVYIPAQSPMSQAASGRFSMTSPRFQAAVSPQFSEHDHHLPGQSPMAHASSRFSMTSPRFPHAVSPQFSEHDQMHAPKNPPSSTHSNSPRFLGSPHSTHGLLQQQQAGTTVESGSPSNEASNTTDLINWLFSDSMLSNTRDLFLPTSFYSAFESPMDLPNLLTPPTPPPTRQMSETKRLDILGLIPSLEGEPDMELDAIHRFINLFWDRFHFQFPILHRPSFEADATPGPLLWSIIMIGSHYGGAHGLALKIAEHLRWVIFGSPGFHPPAKIWIIQSLLFLEVFEKTMSTRKFHERAHIHHATTLQLIRRGSTLLGSTSASTSSSSTTASNAGMDGSSEVWKRWIDAEMAKRAAFMAFILDVCHAALFAHSVVLSTHEIRLSLPCDDSAWDTVPGDRSHVVRTPTMPFLKALKKLLNQQSVATGRFGSVVLLCGLMSLSYQMEQLDLQISSLGWGAFRDTWRTTLAPALDFWKADYDRRYPALEEHEMQRAGRSVEEGGYGSSAHLQRLVPPMWHMAHISMRVSIYDLEIFCGVHRVLGRPTRYEDFAAAKRRMTDWAISERAPDAAFHAAQGLYEAIVVGDLGSYYRAEGYVAGQDAFVHRAYILAHSAMLVWAYGYCLEGPESGALGERDREVAAAAAAGRVPATSTSEGEDERAIGAAEPGRAFLERMCACGTAREMAKLRGKSRTVGLLRVVIEALQSSKWQLVHEVCDVLKCCIQRSLGRDEASVRGGREYYEE